MKSRIYDDGKLFCRHKVEEEVNAIEIPQNATNGDMIEIMFPNIEVKPFNFDGKLIGYDVWNLDNGTNGETYFTKDFWDAPYRKVEE